MLATVGLLVLALVAVTYLWVKRQFSILKNYGFQHEKPKFPLGNYHNKTHVVNIILELYDKFKGGGSAFGIYFSFSPCIVVTDLSAIGDILVNDFDQMTNRGIFYNKKSDPLSAHLLSLEDDEWKRLREKLVPFFTSHKMKMIFGTVLNVSKYMLLNLAQAKNLDALDAKEIFSKYIIDVIGNVVFGVEMNAEKNPNLKFRKVGMRLLEFRSSLMVKTMLMICFKKLARVLRLRLIPQEVSNFFIGIVKATVKYRSAMGIVRKDILDILMERDAASGKRALTDDEIAAQCFTFFISGFETSAGTGAFALYSLAIDQDIQEKLRDDMRLVLKRHENKITYDSVHEMRYLQMVIDETLRLYPPIYQVVRKSAKDYKIANSDLVIPRETLVAVPIICIHRDAEYYPNPERFDPERFSEENKATRHPMTYLPFSQGGRNCIGTQFALMQIKIALVQILTHYRVSPNEKTPKSIEFSHRGPLLISSTGLSVRLEKLSD